MRELDGVGLGAHDRREAELRRDGGGAQGCAFLEYFAAGVRALVLAVFHFPSPLVGGWHETTVSLFAKIFVFGLFLAFRQIYT
jgi:hypothetical protein